MLLKVIIITLTILIMITAAVCLLAALTLKSKWDDWEDYEEANNLYRDIGHNSGGVSSDDDSKG